MTRRWVALAAAVVLAVTLSACDATTRGKPERSTGTATSDPGSSTPSSGSAAVSGTEQTGEAADGSPGDPQRPVDQLRLSDMLALIPDRADNQVNPVVVNLYWKAAAAGKITVPPHGADQDAILDYAMALTNDVQQAVGMAGSDLVSQLAQFPDSDPGFGLGDIAADVQTQTLPRVALAARGRFDLSGIDTKLRGNAAWKDELSTPNYRGSTIYRWADDLKQDISKVQTGLFTKLGQSRRFSFPNPSTFEFARDDATMHALLDAQDGATTTLADIDEFAAIAEALDRHGVYSAIFTAPVIEGDLMGTITAKGPAPSSATIADLRARLAEYALKPYQRAGLGETLTDGRPQTILVLANVDHAAAQANVGAVKKLVTSGSSIVLNRAWSDIFTVDSVTAEGSLTVAVLDLTPAEDGGAGNSFAWIRSVWTRDNLLMMAG